MSSEHRALYNKYSAVIRKRNSLENEENKKKAREAARKGLKALGEIRSNSDQRETKTK